MVNHPDGAAPLTNNGLVPVLFIDSLEWMKEKEAEE
jgi:hypothetical protein